MKFRAIPLVLPLAALAVPLAAQQVPADLTQCRRYRTTTSRRRRWGDPDLTGTWPIDNIASIFVTRLERFGNRFYLTQEELKQRAEQENASEKRYKTRRQAGQDRHGPLGRIRCQRRADRVPGRSANGKLPAFTERRGDVQGRPFELERPPVRLGERLRHLGSLHHPRLPGLDVPVPLQQRHPHRAVARASSSSTSR